MLDYCSVANVKALRGVPSSITGVQECDTRNDDSSHAAQFIILKNNISSFKQKLTAKKTGQSKIFYFVPSGAQDWIP